jgi:hypothetical protein
VSVVERFPPLVEGMNKRRQIHFLMMRGIGREIAAGALEQRAAAHQVAAGMVVQGDGHLDQALQKLAFRFGGGAPDIFQDLVGFKETVLLEEPKTFPVSSGRHSSDYARNHGREVGSWKVKAALLSMVL